MHTLEARIFHSAILIVDDNPTNVALLEGLLNESDYDNVYGITDPREVVAYVEKSMPDLLLLDIRMPHINGHELMAALKERFGDDLMPVIVLTAQTDMETRIKALEGGARDFLTKPFDPIETLQRVRNTLVSHELFKQRKEQARLLEDLVAERTRELEYVANHDPLTELVNRRVLLKTLEECRPQQTVILFISLDHTERVAELHGHGCLEALLKAVGQRLKACLPPAATMGCWGGTDFLVILPNATLSEGEACAQLLLEQLKLPFPIGSNQIAILARFGIHLAQDESAEESVRRASLSIPPRLWIHPWRVYTPQLDEVIRKRHAMENLLIGALKNNELRLFYQPKMDLKTGKVMGAEALMRWQSAELGMVSPGVFIPLAEETGLIIEFGLWALRTATQSTREWIQAGIVPENFTIAVNVATRQLEVKDLAQQISIILEESGLPGPRLELEVTESGLMRDVENSLICLNELGKIGCGIAIDDFGTGYSSLAYLKQMPVTTLKIDQAFVRDLETDESDQAIVRTIIAMAQSLNLKVVAEGIETEAHALFLRNHEAHTAQGFLYSRPLPKEDFEAFCRQPKQ